MDTKTKLIWLKEHEQKVLDSNGFEGYYSDTHQDNIELIEKYIPLIGELNWDDFVQLILYLAEQELGCDCM